MRGLMMDRPLLISSLLEHAATVFGSVEIVTRTVEGPIYRYTWTDASHRSKQLLQALQLRDGYTVATHARDRALFGDLTFVPLVGAIWDKLEANETIGDSL